MAEHRKPARGRIVLALAISTACANCAALVPVPVGVSRPEAARLEFRQVHAYRTKTGVQVTGRVERPVGSHGILAGQIRVLVFTSASGSPLCAEATRTPFSRRAIPAARFRGYLPLDRDASVTQVEVRYDAAPDNAPCRQTALPKQQAEQEERR